MVSGCAALGALFLPRTEDAASRRTPPRIAARRVNDAEPCQCPRWRGFSFAVAKPRRASTE
jgi:hypothetical protein